MSWLGDAKKRSEASSSSYLKFEVGHEVEIRILTIPRVRRVMYDDGSIGEKFCFFIWNYSLRRGQFYEATNSQFNQICSIAEKWGEKFDPMACDLSSTPESRGGYTTVTWLASPARQLMSVEAMAAIPDLAAQYPNSISAEEYAAEISAPIEKRDGTIVLDEAPVISAPRIAPSGSSNADQDELDRAVADLQAGILPDGAEEGQAVNTDAIPL